MSDKTGSKKAEAYHFHPLELGVMGYSGSGKTTLIVRLIEELKARWSMAYVKHDAHAFTMDRNGKDTQRASEAGARSVFISNADRWASLGEGDFSLLQRKTQFLDADCLIIEGYKSLPVDKLCVLDAEGAILDELNPESRESIKAYVGPDLHAPASLPGGALYFSRDSIKEITRFVESLWNARLAKRKLRALVLAGGRSTRMGQDKGRISYHGKAHALWVCDLISELGVPPTLSLRDGQWSEEEHRSYPTLTDRFLDFGPMGGILSAMHEDPNAAWLVVACDLPLLNRRAIEHLLSRRDPRLMATAYLSTEEGLPEPLCTVYEPKIRMRLHEAMGLGIHCPRKVLLNTPSQLIEAIDPEALANANTPLDLENHRRTLRERSHEA